MTRATQGEMFRKSAPYPLRERRRCWLVSCGVIGAVTSAFLLYALIIARAWLTPAVWVSYPALGVLAVSFVVLMISEVRFCRRMDADLHCWDCHYIVDKGFDGRCSECGMDIEESRALWAAFKPGRIWGSAGHDLIQWKDSPDQATDSGKVAKRTSARLARFSTGNEKIGIESEEARATGVPYPSRVWRGHIRKFQSIVFRVGFVGVVVFCVLLALILTEQLDHKWIPGLRALAFVPWVKLVPPLIVAAIYIVPEIILKCAQLRLCHLNRKAPRCWDCSNVVDEALGDACSKCGMSIEKSRALWSFYDPLRPWTHPGAEVKWRAWKEAQEEKA
jgi:hypothetical protein